MATTPVRHSTSAWINERPLPPPAFTAQPGPTVTSLAGLHPLNTNTRPFDLTAMRPIILFDPANRVYGKVMGVDGRVRGVEGQVQGVRGDVQDVHGDVRKSEASMTN